MSSLKFINRATGALAQAEVQARKAGARIDKATAKVVAHIDGATSLVENAAKTIDRVIPWVDGSAIRRGLDALNAGAAKLAASKAAEIQAAAGKLQGAVGTLGKSFTALTGIGGSAGGKAAEAAQAVSSLALAANQPSAAPPSAADGKYYLLQMSAGSGASFRFGLGGAAFDQLRRQTTFNVAAQERLLRPEALQVINKGGETLSLSGAVYAGSDATKGGNPITQLRAIGAAVQPLLLTTGYGEQLGHWLMVSIAEEQSAHFSDGKPRKQTFTLEFKRYGNDIENL